MSAFSQPHRIACGIWGGGIEIKSTLSSRLVGCKFESQRQRTTEEKSTYNKMKTLKLITILQPHRQPSNLLSRVCVRVYVLLPNMQVDTWPPDPCNSAPQGHGSRPLTSPQTGCPTSMHLMFYSSVVVLSFIFAFLFSVLCQKKHALVPVHGRRLSRFFCVACSRIYASFFGCGVVLFDWNRWEGRTRS